MSHQQSAAQSVFKCINSVTVNSLGVTATAGVTESKLGTGDNVGKSTLVWVAAIVGRGVGEKDVVGGAVAVSGADMVIGGFDWVSLF